MKKIEWSRLFSMGSEVLDSHHQMLISYINALDDAIDAGIADRAFLLDIAGKLADYTDFHFRKEEEIMDHFGYPALKEHKEEHGEFIKEVDRFRSKIESGEEKLDCFLVSCLKTWLIQHILVIDKEYAIWFAEQGIELE